MTPKRVSVRLMAPFSMRCTSCNHFIYKSTKFNARKSSTGERYLDIPIHQFAIRCPNCSHDITFKTDPKASGYTIISGATRNLDPMLRTGPGTGLVDAKIDPSNGEIDSFVRPPVGAAKERVADQSRDIPPRKSLSLQPLVASPAAPSIPSMMMPNTAVTVAEAGSGANSASSVSRVSKALPTPKRRKHLAKT